MVHNSDHAETHNRRKILRYAGGSAVLGTIGLAGCLGGDNDDGGNGNGGNGNGNGGNGNGNGGNGNGGNGNGGNGNGNGGNGNGNGDVDFPNRDIEFIIPHSAGGGYDTMARLLCEEMPANLPGNVDMIPQNVTGAGGRTGMNEIYRADPDGYTFGMVNMMGHTTTEVVNPDSVDFDLEQISWIGKVASNSHTMYASADSGFETYEDFQEADQVMFGNEGPGTTGYLVMTIVADVMDINFNSVTGYESSQEVYTGVLRGDVDASSSGPNPFIIEGIEEGEIIPVIYFGEQELEWQQEAGSLEGTEYEFLNNIAGSQFGVGGPPDMDDAVLEVIRDAFWETVSTDEFQESLGNALSPAYGPPDDAETTEQIYYDIKETLSEYADELE